MFTLAFKFVLILVSCLVSVAFFTLLERKILGVVGYRLGPFKISMGGFLQPIADAGKLFNKEVNSLSNLSFLFYYLSSSLVLLFSFIFFSMISGDNFGFNFKSSLLLILVVLGFNSLNSILSGWSTYSKYSLLGSLRSVSQLVSYEISLYICFFFFFFCFFSFDLISFFFFPIYFIFSLLPLIFFCWLICLLAELNRTPYDFSEGESELVSGFNIEFGSSCFTLIFLAEYGMIFFFMYLSSFLFFFYNVVYSTFFFFWVLWIRSVLPRYRFDKLMSLSWKVLIPQLGLFFVLFLLVV